MYSREKLDMNDAGKVAGRERIDPPQVHNGRYAALRDAAS